MADDKPEFITPPNTLKSKVRTGGPGAVDMAALDRAEQVIVGLTDNYLEWVQEDLEKIDRAYEALKKASGDRTSEVDAVFQASHDIKSQGGSFGYDMMTAIGYELCRLIEKAGSIGPGEMEAINLHINAMKLVIAEDIKGEGGEQGKQMLSGLQQVCEKLLA